MSDEIVYFPDYKPDKDKDDDHILHIKEAVDKLDTLSKLIFLTYCELGSYAACARYWKVSKPTAKKYIQKIKEKIYDNL